MGEIVQLMISKSMEQLSLSLTALALCVICGVALGILLSRARFLYRPVMLVVSVFQTIPSLALLALMIPVFGIGRKPAVAALFIYCILPVLQNTYTGLTNVNQDLVDVAKGLGFSQKQILFKVRLPLSSRMIMAGIRLAAVFSICWATLSSMVGAGGCGDLIFNGMNLYDIKLIIAGTAPIMFFSVLFDYLLAALEEKLSSGNV